MLRMSELSQAGVWQALRRVLDPEIPVLSVVDLGIIRRADLAGGAVRIQMTPTYSGCPALVVMQDEIRRVLQEAGAQSVDVETVLDPPWSSDWLTEEARVRLREYGIAPAPLHGGWLEIVWSEPALCPRCGSAHTQVKNAFGSTACRSIHVCQSCHEPFEAFKPL